MTRTLLRRHQPASEMMPVERIFGDFFEGFPFSALGMSTMGVDEGLLPVDLSENETNYIIRASLPGFDKDDVQVEVHDGVMTINAQHEEEEEEKNERYYRRERRVGSLTRRIALPGQVLENDTQAQLRDGVLTVRVPKAKPETPHKVKIS